MTTQLAAIASILLVSIVALSHRRDGSAHTRVLPRESTEAPSPEARMRPSGDAPAAGVGQSRRDQRLAGTPELPRAFLDTRLSAQMERRIGVQSGRDLQEAIDDARPGDVLLLEAGATFVGNFDLPRKSGAGWITIRSSAAGKELPPQGERVTPRHRRAMPKIMSPNERSAIRTREGAHHYRLIGIEVSALPEVRFSQALVALGDGSRKQNSSELVPHDLVLDRMYVHGHAGLHLKRCVALNSASTAVVDSYLAECHGRGQDTQAIAGWNGPGPFKIVNNYLEGAGENVMFGGADPAIPGLVPSDIEIRRNHFTKPLAWKSSNPWTVKNLLELKNAQRVLVEGNVFENSWAHAQIGFAVVMWSANDGRCTWCVTQDVTFRYNRIHNVNHGFQLTNRSPGAIGMRRVLIAHNVLTSVGAASLGGGGGRLYQMAGPIVDLTIEHNTAFAPNSQFLFVSDPPAVLPGLVLRNNIGGAQYNIFSSYGQGATALRLYGGPKSVFRGNVIVGGSKPEPPGNRFPANYAAVMFVDYEAGDLRLAPRSPFRRTATDGTDPGADVQAVTKHTAGVVAP